MSLSNNEYATYIGNLRKGYTRNPHLPSIISHTNVRNRVADGLPWPPNNAKARVERLEIMKNLYNGSFIDVYTKHLYTSTNFFALACQTFSNELTAVPPIVEGQDAKFNRSLRKTAYKAITDLVRYGSSVTTIFGNEESGWTLDVVDPMNYFPTNDGGYIIAAPYVSSEAENDTADRIKFTHYDPIVSTDSVKEYTFNYNNGITIGEAISMDEKSTFEGAVIHTGRSPSEGEWGYRVFEDILPLALELAIRRNDTNYILGYHTRPRKAARINTKDVEDLLGVDEDADFDDFQEQANEALEDMWSEDTDFTIVNDEFQSIEAVVWDTQFPLRQWSSEEITSEIYYLLGVVLKTAGQQNQGRSGLAIGRENSIEYNGSSSMLNTVQPTLQMHIEAAGIEGEVEMTHPFDDDRRNTAEQQMQQVNEEQVQG